MTTSTQRQSRRGTTGGNDGLTGAAGEITFDTTLNRLRLHDGARAGGWQVPNHADLLNQAMRHGGAVDASSNALTLVITPVPAAWVTDMKLKWRVVTGANTGPCTIGITSLAGSKNLKKIVSGTITALGSGDQTPGMEYEGVYNGTDVVITSVLNHGGGTISVSQGNLNTSTGSVSVASATVTNLTLPGGLYGFYPQVKASGGGVSAQIASSKSTTSYLTNIALSSASGANTAFAQQQYVTASPPFDLGDGELAGFVFAKVNKAGNIVASYIADVPPWAYNGPTRIRADHVCPITGKKSRSVPKRRSLDEIIGGAPFEYELQEITQEIKNADMHLIPHPFPDALGPDETIVLLNPRDDRLARIMEHHGNGGDDEIVNALHSGKIYADNEFLRGMKGPPGVKIAPLCFKYSR